MPAIVCMLGSNSIYMLTAGKGCVMFVHIKCITYLFMIIFVALLRIICDMFLDNISTYNHFLCLTYFTLLYFNCLYFHTTLPFSHY